MVLGCSEFVCYTVRVLESLTSLIYPKDMHVHMHILCLHVYYSGTSSECHNSTWYIYYVMIQCHILWRDVSSGTCDEGSLLVSELSLYCPHIYNNYMSGCLDVSWTGQMCCFAQIVAEPRQARYIHLYISVHTKHNTDYTTLYICTVDWWVWIMNVPARIKLWVVLCKVQLQMKYYNLIRPHSEEVGHDF